MDWHRITPLNDSKISPSSVPVLKRIRITAEGLGLGEEPEQSAQCKFIWKGQCLAKKELIRSFHFTSFSIHVCSNIDI